MRRGQPMPLLLPLARNRISVGTRAAMPSLWHEQCHTSCSSFLPLRHTRPLFSTTSPSPIILKPNSPAHRYSTASTPPKSVSSPSSTEPFWKQPRWVKQRKAAGAEPGPSTREIDQVLDHITDVHPRHYHHILKGDDGKRRAKHFTRLHDALNTPKNPEAIWEVYQLIRNVPEDLGMLSSDIQRLLVMHFKQATAPRLSSTSRNGHLEAAEQLWSARIVTVLDDKRKLAGQSSRWDLSDMMSALNQLERYEEALEELEQALANNNRNKNKMKMDPILLNHAVRAWGGLERLDKAILAVQDARVKYGIRASEFTLGYLIQRFLMAGSKATAISFWQELVNDGALENIETVNGILRACVHIGDSRFGQTVYDSLSQLGIESNLESLNLMLSLAVAEIRYPEERSDFLRSIHDRISQSDKPVFERRVLDSILVDFSKKGDAEGAVLVLQLMLNHGFRPEIDQYNDVLHCFARLGDMGKAIDWFWRMRQSGVRPDRFSYMVLMQAYTQQRKPREAEAIFRQMVIDGVEPDLNVSNFLLLAYEQSRMNRRCLQLYKSMLQDRSIRVNHFTFSCMFNAVFHNDKALLEGSEGLDGRGSTTDDMEFLAKIGETIGQPMNDTNTAYTTSESEGSQNTEPADKSVPTTTQYQFENAESTTVSLNPRSLFRDMIIVGIRPTRSLFSNILRAFLAQNDYAGAVIALRALVDYYVLKPTPKMNAIVVTWVSQELERRGPSSEENALTRGELTKLISMIGRSRGLISMLEKIATVERWGGEDQSQEDAASRLTVESSQESQTKKSTRTSRLKQGFPAETAENLFARVAAKMGGDLVDLTKKSVIAGSSWSTAENNPTKLDLKDFEKWYRVYSNRRTYAQVLKKTL